MKSQIRASKFLLSNFRLYKKGINDYKMGEAALFCKRGLPPIPYLPKIERRGISPTAMGDLGLRPKNPRAF